MVLSLKELGQAELVGRRFDYQVLAVTTAPADPVVVLAAGGIVSAQLRVDTNGDALAVAVLAEVYDAAGAVVTRENLGLITVKVQDNSGSGKELIPTEVPLQLFAPCGPQEPARPLRIPIYIKGGGVLALTLRNGGAAERRVRIAFEVLRFTATGAFTL